MQFTLRKAHKIKARIHAVITGLTTEVRLKDSNDRINTQLVDAQAALTTSIHDALNLVSVKYSISQKIGIANSTSNINNIMTQLEKLKAQRAVLSAMRLDNANANTYLIFDDIELKRTVKTEYYDTLKATTHVVVTTDEHALLIKTKLKDIEKQIESLNDEREALNNTVTITLLEEEVALLEAADVL